MYAHEVRAGYPASFLAALRIEDVGSLSGACGFPDTSCVYANTISSGLAHRAAPHGNGSAGRLRTRPALRRGRHADGAHKEVRREEDRSILDTILQAAKRLPGGSCTQQTRRDSTAISPTCARSSAAFRRSRNTTRAMRRGRCPKLLSECRIRFGEHVKLMLNDLRTLTFNDAAKPRASPRRFQDGARCQRRAYFIPDNGVKISRSMQASHRSGLRRPIAGLRQTETPIASFAVAYLRRKAEEHLPDGDGIPARPLDRSCAASPMGDSQRSPSTRSFRVFLSAMRMANVQEQPTPENSAPDLPRRMQRS